MRHSNLLKKMLVVTCSIIIVVGSFAGCGKSSSRVSNNEIVEAIQPESGGYDPAGATGYDYFSFAMYCLEGLVKYDEKGKIISGAAETWDSNTEGTVWTFHLRKDAKWSDGSPVTSADFMNTITRALDPATGSWYVDGLYVIKGAKDAFEGKGSIDDIGVKCADDNTIEFTLNTPCAYFLDYLSLPVYFPSNAKNAVSNTGWDKDPSKNLANGPFHLTKYSAGDYLVYEKNTNYWDAKSISLAKITDKIMTDDQAKVSAFKTGEIDIANSCPQTVLDQYKDSGSLQTDPTMVTNYVLFNINMAPFDNPMVREAFSLAVNRADICTVIGSNNESATTFIAKNLISKASGKTWGEDAGELLTEDATKAKQLLADAGYPDGKGLPELTYTYPSMGNEAEVAQVLQSSWKQNLGVDVKLNAEEYEVYVSDRQKASLQFCRMQWTGDYDDPATWLNMYVTDSAFDDVKYSSPEYDGLVAQSTSEMDPVKRDALMHQAESVIVAKDFVICPLFTTNGLYLYNPKLENLIPGVMGGYKNPFLKYKDGSK